MRGSDLLPVLLFALIWWIGNKCYHYGYNKGVEDERRRQENK